MTNKYKVIVPQIGLAAGQTVTAKELHPSSANVKALVELGHLELVETKSTSKEGNADGSSSIR